VRIERGEGRGERAETARGDMEKIGSNDMSAFSLKKCH
jgi:hypothetical protein